MPTHTKEELEKAKFDDGSYWEERQIPKEFRLKSGYKYQMTLSFCSNSDVREKRWQTVRDALVGLPNPLKSSSEQYLNHKFRPGAKIYNGHSGSVLDEPSKTIKAGDHGVPGGENMFFFR